MIEVAVVEDFKADSDKIKSFIERYEKEKNEKIKASYFADGLDFLDSLRSRRYDIIYLDIEMPYMNGMSVAKEIRKTDKKTAIVFVTNLSGYAVEGYEVEAKAFLVKPVAYADFAFKTDKIIKSLVFNAEKSVSILSGNKLIRVPASEITFVESKKHAIIYHTVNGDYCVWDKKMDEVEELLTPLGFARCNSGYVVNVSFITEIDKTSVTVGGEVLPVSRGRKKSFMQAVTLSLGEKL